jgi:hypothetical protein
LRARQGLATCSQCALREEQCHLDDSDDVRIRQRRLFTARGDITDAGVLEPQTALVNTSLDNREKPTSSFSSASHFEYLPPENGSAALLQYPDNLFADNTFGLSLDSVLFLDQVFMGDCGPTEWNSRLPMTNQQYPTSTTDDGQAGNQEQHGHINTSPDETLDPSSWLGGSADSTTFTAALYSYFNFAAPHLPILFEDAFWQDYHASRCSQTLVYAIACRGMPFTAAANKWDLQQRLACKFREAFLDARSTASDDGTIRLDDLEALALMINFEYEDAGSPPLHSNLGRLFLKHESLVLMTLQSRIHDRDSTDSNSSAMLARAGERRVLLYWHVYGLDAFHCLDHKQISHIPDNDTHSNESLPQHETKDYFDAILALAIIARKTIQTLCSAVAKRRGVEPNDVHILYEQLYHWKNNGCPRHLRRHKDSAGKLITSDPEGSNASVMEKHTQLRRAVLWVLEINCSLQIECCVSDYGIQDGRSLEAEVTAIRVEYESVRALNDMIDICRWMKQHEIRDRENKRHSLIDLAPVLRNICAGMCFWSCQRGIGFCRCGLPSLLQQSHLRGHTSGGGDKKRHINTYAESAQLLRDAVATATSHKDTAQVLERLDKQRDLLKAELSDIQTIHQFAGSSSS